MPLVAFNPTITTTPAGGTTGGYQLIVVDKTGQRFALGELRNAEPQTCSELLNEAGSASFTIPTLDAHAAAVVGLERELQIWRHGRILWWGPIVRPEANAKRVDVQCRTLEWYFERLNFGRADRTNLLANPSAETGDLTGWTLNGSGTAVATTGVSIDGGWSFRLDSGAALQDNYLEQVVDNYGATGVGTNLILAGYYFIDPAGWIGEALDGLGVMIKRLNATTGAVLKFDRHDIVAGTDAGVPGMWHRFEKSVSMPPDAVEDIEVRLYSPGGRIYFDALTLTIPESVSSVSSPTDFTDDLANLFAEIVEHAQDATFDKPDLNIGVDAPLTGVRVDQHYQFSEHPPIGSSLRQFSAEGLAEWWVAFTATARTATLRAPRRGSRKPQFRVYLEGEAGQGTTHANIADDFRFSFDGEQAANSVVVLGAGDGPDREEGGAVDAAAFGGMVYEEIVAAPAEASIDSLDNLAAERLRVLKTPEILRVTYLPRQKPGQAGYVASRDPIDSLQVGDTIPVFMDYGWLQVPERDYRVTAKEIDMRRDLATYTLNRAT